jgi:4-carboxymuconolactone decarboxylase
MTESRFERVTPESMDQNQRELYETLTNGPRSKDPSFPLTHPDGSLQGPFAALLLSPVIGTALQELGNALRRTSELSPREREIAILLVGSYWECAFELDTHERIARDLGLSDDELASLRHGTVPDFADRREKVCATVTQALTGAAGRIDEKDWDSWTRHIGVVGVFELTSIVGYYSTLALQLRVFATS